MSFLLDTNVLSEGAKRRPHPRVRAWLERTPAGETFLSALTLGELVQGVERAPEARRRVLEGWVQRVKRG
ncbi:PIN domain-containing protein, partial [Thermus sp.]|uniref:PIN domain-containing protein n=1 Tax=Thermus sp. TaxID=275 RepID=UPI002600F0D4